MYSFLLFPSGKVRKYVDNISGFTVDEFEGRVHMWFHPRLVNGKYNVFDCAFCTGYTKWDKATMRFIDYDQAYIKGNGPIGFSGSGTVPPAFIDYVFAFKDIVCKFYKKYKKSFGEEWEARVQELCTQALPKKPTPVFIPDVPKAA